MNKTDKLLHRPWVWCAVVAVGSTLVGVWNAQKPQRLLLDEFVQLKIEPSEVESTTTHKDNRVHQIEATLARAGCPGWMVLASEGESALEPPADAIVPKSIQPTSSRVPKKVPRVKYPVPVRVASRPVRSPETMRVALSQGSPDDADDLLDGEPDLLREAAPNLEEPQATEPVEQAPATEPNKPATISPEQEPNLAPNNDLKLVTPTPSGTSEQSTLPTEVQPGPAVEFKVITPTPATESPVEAASPKTESTPVVAPPIATPVPADSTPPAAPAENQDSNLLPEQLTTPGTKPETLPNKDSSSDSELLEIPSPTPDVSPFDPPPAPETITPHTVAPANNGGKQKTYCEFIADSLYPSAQACAKCHQKIFDEWSVSSHAYAMISPMFHKFEQTINDISQGTSGYFCYRCHSPAGVSMGISRAAPLWELPLVAREGVTCVSCHRVNERFAKVNGERRIVPGDIHAPVYGSIGGSGVAEVISQKDHYKVKTSPHDQRPGQDIHVAGVCFDQLSKPEFCVSCHQVAVHPGIKLEVVWEQYRASPACKKGISCQDCHMGRIPGVPSGYEVGAAATVNDKVVNNRRKHANHVFYGPGYSIAHPGIFPFNPKAERWTMPEWLMFDYRAGWGTDEFEDLIESGQIHVNFPPVWQEVDDRFDAREIIEANQKKLNKKTHLRVQLMENGSHVDGPFFDSPLNCGNELKFHYVMTNNNEGHNLPTGSLGAQPQLWANVVLINPQGKRVWESGYTDRWGDVADIHSEDVRNKRIPYDWQLFNLQTMFLITGAKGTDREFFLPVNVDFDQLPFLRPGAQPISVINHPPFIRMEGRSLAPLGSRRIPYKVPAHLVCQPGRYRLSFRLRSRAEPIYFMRFVGATQEMQRAMNEGMINFHESSVEFIVR